MVHAPNPVIADLMSWAEDFKAGRVEPPAAAAGVLEPGEHLAVAMGPVMAAALVLVPTPTVTEAGATGRLVATDRRVTLLPEDGEIRSWLWGRDVEQVTPMRDGLGVCWTPSADRQAAGVHHIEGLVVPALARGERPAADRQRFLQFGKVQAAWRASRPGGVDGWISELRERYRA